MEHELWFTALLNKMLAGVVSPLLAAIGYAPADAAHPVPNYVAMEIFVMLVIFVGALALRSCLSVENPGKLQHAMEVVVEFVQSLTDEIIGHGGRRYAAMIATLGIFIALCNLLGLVPTLATPTASIQVTLGCAVAAFLYYNFHGFRQHGLVGYLKHLCGPMMAIAIIMFPIEVVGNFGRLLSLSVRLYANMMVGDLLEKVFGGLVPILVPAAFMALHVFVSLLQAYVFMLLPAVYISMAVAEEH
ncbi:MAG: F0F1 ATP synthase subunit A [Terriglobia bacterium]